ncbi:MAG: DnaJ domain-containing protein, partial [Candidatus Methylomirabilia bacterium]
MRRDYYAVLEVAVSSTEREIRSAFRRLARQYSPDVNLWDRQARALFQEINEAYRVLSDTTTRSLYDRYGHQAFHQEREGRADRPAGAVRGDDLHLPVDLSFADAARGLSLTLELRRLSPCSQCSASGGRRGTAPESCLRCAGTGTIRTVGRSGPQPCPSCHGFG